MNWAIIIVALLECTIAANGSIIEPEDNWDYRNNGPDIWPKANPDCGGSYQSPINIVTRKTRPANASHHIAYHNFRKNTHASNYKMINTGNTIAIEIPQDTNYVVKKGSQKYIPQQVQFHFDSIKGRGSEHTLNRHKFFGEIQIINMNAKYNSIKMFKHSDGILGIAIFVELMEIPNSKTSAAMKIISRSADELQNSGGEVLLKSFPLGIFLPTHRRKHARFGYVNYKGSLTTPPCSEAVDWIVITGKTLMISPDMARTLTKIMDSDKMPMAGNNRPTQWLSDRTVFRIRGSIDDINDLSERQMYSQLHHFGHEELAERITNNNATKFG